MDKSKLWHTVLVEEFHLSLKLQLTVNNRRIKMPLNLLEGSITTVINRKLCQIVFYTFNFANSLNG